MDICAACGGEAPSGRRSALGRPLSTNGRVCRDFLQSILKTIDFVSPWLCRRCFEHAENLNRHMSKFVDTYRTAFHKEGEQETGISSESSATADRYVPEGTVRCIAEFSPTKKSEFLLTEEQAKALIEKDVVLLVKGFWEDQDVRHEMVQKVINEVKKECADLCRKSSGSIFMDNDAQQLSATKIVDAAKQMSAIAPLTFKVLLSIGSTNRPSRHSDPEAEKEKLEKCVVIPAAILLKSRNKDASAFQLQLSLLLKHHGLRAQGINFLHDINLAVHNHTLMRMQKQLEPNDARIDGMADDSLNITGEIRGEDPHCLWMDENGVECDFEGAGAALLTHLVNVHLRPQAIANEDAVDFDDQQYFCRWKNCNRKRVPFLSWKIACGHFQRVHCGIKPIKKPITFRQRCLWVDDNGVDCGFESASRPNLLSHLVKIHLHPQAVANEHAVDTDDQEYLCRWKNCKGINSYPSWKIACGHLKRVHCGIKHMVIKKQPPLKRLQKKKVQKTVARVQGATTRNNEQMEFSGALPESGTVEEQIDADDTFGHDDGVTISVSIV